MGCSSAQQTSDESTVLYKKIDNSANESNIYDKIIDDFFKSNNEEELSAFLVTTKYFHIKKEILKSIINGENIEIYSEYEKCKEFSIKGNKENEFLIVSEDYMKNKYKSFEKIKEKKDTIKKNSSNWEIYFENHNNYIRFQKSKNELFSFINVDNDINYDSNIRRINKLKYNNLSKENK